MFLTYDKEMQGYETMWCWSSSIEADLCRDLLTNTQHEAEIELLANYYVLEKLPWFYLTVMMNIRIDLQLAPLGWWLTTPPAMMQITPPNHGHRWSKRLRCSEIKRWLMKNLPAGSPVVCGAAWLWPQLCPFWVEECKDWVLWRHMDPNCLRVLVRFLLLLAEKKLCTLVKDG